MLSLLQLSLELNLLVPFTTHLRERRKRKIELHARERERELLGVFPCIEDHFS